MTFENPEKSHFGPITSPLWPKNFKITLFPKKSFASILSLYAATSCKNSEKYHALTSDGT